MLTKWEIANRCKQIKATSEKLRSVRFQVREQSILTDNAEMRSRENPLKGANRYKQVKATLEKLAQRTFLGT